MGQARDEIKVQKVIDSCTTLAQCQVARNLIYNWEKFYNKMNHALTRLVEAREQKVRYRKRGPYET